MLEDWIVLGILYSIEIMNSVWIVGWIELVIVVWIVDEWLLCCLTKLYAYYLSDALL